MCSFTTSVFIHHTSVHSLPECVLSQRVYSSTTRVFIHCQNVFFHNVCIHPPHECSFTARMCSFTTCVFIHHTSVHSLPECVLSQRVNSIHPPHECFHSMLECVLRRIAHTLLIHYCNSLHNQRLCPLQSVVMPSAWFRQLVNKVIRKKQVKNKYKIIEDKLADDSDWPPLGGITRATEVTPISIQHEFVSS